MDGKQGPWSDIYSAAAVLHHAITGRAPPDAAARVGTDPYRPLSITQAGRFEPAFLGAIDRALAFVPTDRPQTVEEWAALFGRSIARVADAPTQRLGGAAATPRLGGARREVDQPEAAASQSPRRSRWRRMTPWVVLLLIVIAGTVLERRFRPELQALFSPRPVEVAQPVTPPVQVWEQAASRAASAWVASARAATVEAWAQAPAA